MIKNVSYSTFHKKTPYIRSSLRKSNKIVSSTFIYEPIMMKIYMNAKIMNAQIFPEI